MLADRIATLDTALDAECRARFVLAPSAHELLGVVTELSPRLWERRPGDADFGSLRVGVGPQPSSIRVEVPSNAGRDHQRAMCELADRYRLLPASPVTVNPRVSGPVGITGPEPHARALARSLVLQAAILHSPDELLIGAVLTVGADEEWGWLKWLPHADAHRSPFGGPLCSSGAAAGAELLHALQGVIDERLESTNGSRTALRSVPRVLLLVEGDAGIERSRFSSVLANGSQVGIDLLWMADDTRRLPNDCRTIVVVDAHGSLLDVTDADTGDELQDIALEGLTPDRAETIARGIAPVVDISAGGDRATELPDAVNLADLLGGVEVLDDPAAIADRWRQAAGSQGSLIAPVGSHVDGTMFVDLRLDGPHGLVAGTTGSGKSEFLQTFIASLAAGQPPNRINFLLVDYKGGSAFGDLATRLENGEIVGEGLHHTVGLITDLSPVLAERALISLRAELQHRERLLSRYRAKDLVEMERRAGPNTPANLVIIVDEFAALAREVPAFVAGIVDIAQRGRSLGLHLLLATQRPQGVITANIRANTNLRVALRMATEDESEDVVGSRVAGRIDRSTPGRAVMRRGPSDLVTFQSAYVGAVSAPTSRSALEIGDFALTGTVWHSPDESATGEERAETDLRRLVRTINAAADAERMPRPRRPWLDPLPMTVDLLALPPSEDDSRLVIGLADHPQFQSQDVATFRPDEEGSVLVYGIGGSGKTVALRTIGVACGLAGNRAPVHVYGIDFAGRGLDLLRPLPHVGEIVAGEDYERLTGLLTSLTDEITTRAERFSIARASNLREFRTSPVGDPRLRRIVVLLDGFDNFQSAYERIDRGRWTEMMSRLVADGRRLGIHFVLTGTRRSSFPIAVSSQMSARFILRLAGDDEYQSVGAEPRWFDDDTPPGRGRIDGTEVQFAVTGGASATALEAAAIERLAAELRQVSGTDEAPRIRVLPATLTRDELDSSLGGAWLITERFEPASPALDLNVLIAGRPRSGRSTALAELLLLVRRHGVDPGVYAAAPGPGPLRDARSFDQLAEDLAEGLSGVVFIDGLDRLGGHACEYRFQDAVRNEQLLVVATADSTAARSFDQTIRAVRSRCDVLVLQPDAETDGDLLGTPLPRSARRYPPGRGLSTLAPGLVVQVAVSVDA